MELCKAAQIAPRLQNLSPHWIFQFGFFRNSQQIGGFAPLSSPCSAVQGFERLHIPQNYGPVQFRSCSIFVG